MSEKTLACLACKGAQLTKYLDTTDYFLTQQPFALYRCSNCEALTTWPQPGLNEIRSYYESPDYISHEANKKGLLNNIYRLARLWTLRRKFSIINKNLTGSTILDIGCGTGEFLAFCMNKGMQVTGVEPSTKARNYAINKHNLNVLENLSLLNAENKSFTCITLWHVLEHFHNPEEAFELLEKVLEPNGKVVIALPNFSSWDASHYQKFWAAYDTPRHLVHFNRNSFTQFAQKRGFRIEKIVAQKLDSFYISLLSEKYKGGSLQIVKAFFSGLFSNIKAMDPSYGHSSLIYILTRKIS